MQRIVCIRAVLVATQHVHMPLAQCCTKPRGDTMTMNTSVATIEYSGSGKARLPHLLWQLCLGPAGATLHSALGIAPAATRF